MKKNKYSIRDIIRRLLIFAALMIASHATRADELQPVWSLAPGDVSFLGTGNTDRGIAYNKATGHLLVASRVDVTVHILDAATGVEIGVLNNGDSIIQGGTYPMNMIGTTDDGAIYVGNLSTSLTTPNFKLYRWESETNDAPTLAFEGDPSGLNDQGASVNPQRWGDSMDVRGSSTNAQILLGSRNGSVAALISTTNGVDHTSMLISNAAAAGSISVAFGAGNTFFTKITAAPAREVSFDPATGTGTVLNTLAIGNNVVPIAVNAASNWLAGIEINRVPPETPDNLILYNISDRSKAPAIIDQEAFAGTADNANFVGYVVFEGDMVFALDTNNGLAAYRVVPTINPPSFATQPIALSILDGGFGSLTASLIGTPPLSYQWAFNGTNLSGATNDSLLLTNVTSTTAGNYSLIVSNAAGTTNSDEVAITILPSVRTSRATQIWSISPNSRPYVTTGNTERGLAYNSLSNHVLVISRTGNIDIHVLDGDTGADLWTMSAPSDVVSGSNPGGFRLNMIDVADDGTVYAANLTTGATDSSPYNIYRWENDGTNAAPVAVFSGAPSGERFGDTFTVRGSGLDTQIIATTRNGTAVALFTTTDGQTFTPTIIDTPDAAAGNFGLGIAFGEGNTFWGKGTGDTALLRHVQFDLGSGIGTILQTFTNLEAYVSTIAVSGSSNLLAALALETPDNLRLYDISNTNAEPILIDQDFFPSDNPNINGTGAIDFGRNRVYALDSNNGIIALQLNGGGGNPPQAASLSTPAVAGETFSFALSGSANASYVVQYSTDLKTWSTLKTVIAGADGKAVVSDSVSDQHRFYRAIAE